LRDFWITLCITGKPQNNNRTDPKGLRPGQHKNKRFGIAEELGMLEVPEQEILLIHEVMMMMM
jgi:hypothetical protein